MKHIRFTLILFGLFPYVSFSQLSPGKLNFFDDTWYGFATGLYSKEVSIPTATESADLDKDGDPDLVIVQEGVNNGFMVMKNTGNGRYALPVKYTSSTVIKDLVLADFNKDGNTDVALTNTGEYYNGNTITIYFNKGRGAFGSPASYSVGTGPVGIIAADLDNDTDTDIAVANHGVPLGATPSTVSILVNNGTGLFSSGGSYPAGAYPNKLAVGKINNDNLPDIVVGNDGQKLNILINQGNNNFSVRVEKNVLTSYAGDINANVETADVDKDGDVDILYSSALTWDGWTGQIALFRNNGDGVFSPLQTIPLVFYSTGASDMEIADMNKDGWPDIVSGHPTARTGDGYQIVLNDGTGNFLPAVLRPAGQNTYAITVADVDNDKDLDVITTDSYSIQITVHLNQGVTGFPVPPLFPSNNTAAGALDAADIDGDGDLDLVSSASAIAAISVKITVQKNNGNGTFTNGVDYSVKDGGVNAKFRDLNGDGKPDLLFASGITSPPYDFHTAINNGDGTFGPRQTWSINACGWSDIDAIDLDKDGDLDVIIAESHSCVGSESGRRLFICRNNGNGTFAAPVAKLINYFPMSIGTGDFNEDGNIDVITGHLGIDLHLGTGTGDLLPPVSFTSLGATFDIAVADFNNDGHLDVATCTEYYWEGMSVFLGNGNGTFKPAQNYDGAYSLDLRNALGVTTGDIDADGDIDIMVGNAASNDISVFLNKGNGTFVFPVRLGMYWGTSAPIYADFNNDGKGDIAAMVALPPLGGLSALAILEGNIPASNAAAKNSIVAGKSKALSTTGMTVINNPFASFINVKFAQPVTGKVMFRLTDVTGRTLATSQINGSSQSIFRFDVSNQSIRNGVYILSAEVDGKKYTASVMKE